jgi:hypothetical protein
MALSCPRRRECGLTFDVQQMLREDFGWRLEDQTFAWRVVIERDQERKPLVRRRRQMGFAGQGAPQAADGILDAAFLPGGMGLTKNFRIASRWRC